MKKDSNREINGIDKDYSVQDDFDGETASEDKAHQFWVEA
jgi:hypothetical protein